MGRGPRVDGPPDTREPPAPPADSEPPALESPAVDAEHRSEIERLLFQVMPGKLENMDEMLEQFSGREEELIVTLNTMNEATLSTANERRWALSSGRTSASGSGREGSGGAAVAELGALGSSAVLGGEDASAHERPDREDDSLRREDDSVAVHSNRSTRAIYCTDLSLVTLLIFSCYD